MSLKDSNSREHTQLNKTMDKFDRSYVNNDVNLIRTALGLLKSIEFGAIVEW